MARHQQPQRIPEPAEPAVPPTTASGKIIYALEIALEPKHSKALTEALSGEGPAPRKLAAIAMGTLEDLANGGILVPPLVVRQMAESLGRTPAVEDILAQFQQGTGRVDGRLKLEVLIDPADEEPLRAAAEFNSYLKPDGSPDTQAYLRNLWETAIDNGWLHSHANGVQRVLMLAPDYAALKEALGRDFETGTELAGLIKEHISDQSASLFAEEVQA